MKRNQFLLAVFLLFTSGIAFADQAAFVHAIMNGADEKQVARMLREGADANKEDHRGQTPLMAAVYWNKPEVVQLLLDKGADVNAKGMENVTPLITAVLTLEPETIKLLLDRGADVNAQFSSGLTALWLAIELGRDDTKTVRLLLDYGADANAHGRKGQTALMFWFGYGASPEKVQLLLDHGADVNARDAEGNTALMIAADRLNASEIIQLLLDHGAEVNAQNSLGRTALNYATEGGNHEAEAILLKHGADQHIKPTMDKPAAESPEPSTHLPVGVAAKENEAAEAKVIDFLQSVHKVMMHGDLKDLKFIEQTLGVKAAWAGDSGIVYGKTTIYTLKEPGSRVTRDVPPARITYSLGKPQSWDKTIEVMQIEILKYVQSQPDTVFKEMQRIFGKPDKHEPDQFCRSPKGSSSGGVLIPVEPQPSGNFNYFMQKSHMVIIFSFCGGQLTKIWAEQFPFLGQQ